jgi:hypothetical protein
MKPPTTGQPPAADPNRTETGTDTGKPYVPHFKSVKMPGVAKGPILPEWLSTYFRKRFRRTDTPASR